MFNAIFNEGNQQILQPPPVPLIVVDQTYVTQQQVSLKLSEQAMSFSGDDFSITDVYTGQPWFSIDGRAFSMRDKKTMCNIYGQPVCNLRAKLISIPPKQEIYAGNSKDQLICQIKKKFSFFQTKLSIPVINKANGQEQKVYVKGDWFEKKAKIHMGDEYGQLIATVSRQIGLKEIFFKQQDYIVTIAPGVDASFIVMVCVALDEFTREQK